MRKYSTILLILFPCLSYSAESTVKITDLTKATSLSVSDVFYVVHDASSYYTTAQEIVDLLNANIDATFGEIDYLKSGGVESGTAIITSASFTGLSTTGNAVVTGQGRFGTLYNAGASTFGGNLTLSGSAANIVLGNNWLSGDGGDEGVFVTAAGDVNFTWGGSRSAKFFYSDDYWTGMRLNTNRRGLDIVNIMKDSNNSIGFFIGTSGDGTEVARINYQGRFGLGTTAPAEVLHVSGDACFSTTGIRKLSIKEDTTGYRHKIISDANSYGIDMYLDYANGAFRVFSGGAFVVQISSASYEVYGAVGNSAAIFDSVAIRSGVYQEGLKAPYKKDIQTLDGKSVDLESIDEVPTIYRYRFNPDWAEEKAEKIYQAELKTYNEQKEKEEARVEKEYQEAVAKYEIEMTSYHAKMDIGDATGFIKPVEPKKQGITLQKPVKRVEPVHEGWQEGFIREKLPERYHAPEGGINLSLIAQDALARVAALEKRIESLEKR